MTLICGFLSPRQRHLQLLFCIKGYSINLIEHSLNIYLK